MYDRIITLLSTSVAEIFCKVAEEYSITCGDCPPDVEYDIDSRIEALAEIMEHAL